MPIKLFALVTCTLAACAMSEPPATRPPDRAAPAAIDMTHPVALRYSALEAGAWTIVMDVLDESFMEQLTVHDATPGSWPDQAAQPLSALDDGHQLWFARLPTAAPLAFTLTDQLIYSGGTGASYTDDDNGAPYAAADGGAALGAGIDIAVVALTPSATELDAELVVRNAAYDKTVRAVFSTDGWATVQAADAVYDHGGGDGAGPGETWRVAVPLDPTAAVGAALQLAVEVEQGGVTSWDNNDNHNYQCTRGDTWTCSGDAIVAAGQ